MKSILAIIPGLLLLAGCEYENPAEIYPINSAPNPTITAVAPDSAVNGITQIRITGQNFAAAAEQNFVYFGTTAGKVIQGSPTEIIVQRPVDISGTFTLKVVTRDAFSPDEYGPYKLEPGVVQFGIFSKYNSIAVDLAENLYAELDKIVYQFSPDGKVTQYGTTSFSSSAMRPGPGGQLYIQKRDNPDFFAIPAGGGEAVKIGRIKSRVSFFDMDAEGYLYSGGSANGLYVTKPDFTLSTEFPGYKNAWAIKAVRVFNGFLYVAADTILKVPDYQYSRIWKHELKGAGQLGERIEVLKWANTGVYATTEPLDLNFAEDGTMYFATTHTNPVASLQADGTLEPLYPGLLETPATQIFWGARPYLYQNRVGRIDDESGLYRIIIGQPGAPYHGRW